MDRQMCIPIGRDGKVPRLSDERIAELRRNIRANTELFTFNPTFQAIDEHRRLKISDPGAFISDSTASCRSARVATMTAVSSWSWAP